MCSVVGYIGKRYSKKFVIEGLSRLEYRGYDSSGFACLDPVDNRLVYEKVEGRLSNLQKKLSQSAIDGFLGIGHTRWSTHGAPSEKNAHPHFDCEKKISIVHNGIIENHHELKRELLDAGHVFHSDTDTEIVAHLFEALFKSHQTLKSTVVDLVNHLSGAYAFIALLQDLPDTMIAVRKSSPLCIGIGDGELFIASDPIAFVGKTKKVMFLPDKSFALLKKDIVKVYDFSGKPLSVVCKQLDATFSATNKDGYEHYMLKEIYEQKTAIGSTVNFLQSISKDIFSYIGITAEQAVELESVTIIGCGTSWHAARIAQFFFEEICMIPVRVLLASEFRYMNFFPSKNSVYIAISQSGETADTLQALSMINDLELPTIALTNVPSSTMVRQASGFLFTQAGQEVAVASTKAFSTQLTALYWFANRIALEKKIITQKQMLQSEQDLLVIAEILESNIERYKCEILDILAKKYCQYKKGIFIGRNISYPFALEAALKLKEISYVFAQCYPAGELKHGPLALVDDETPVYIFSHQDPLLYKKLVVNAQEVKARNGHVIVFAFEGQDELCNIADTAFILPNVKMLLGPLSMTGLMQFFVYHIAKQLGRDIDKPRNLAKSVTVE